MTHEGNFIEKLVRAIHAKYPTQNFGQCSVVGWHERIMMIKLRIRAPACLSTIFRNHDTLQVQPLIAPDFYTQHKINYKYAVRVPYKDKKKLFFDSNCDHSVASIVFSPSLTMFNFNRESAQGLKMNNKQVMCLFWLKTNTPFFLFLSNINLPN